MGAFLKVDKIVKKFGGFCAVDGISFELKKGEILGLVGPNGSGKTTCINVLSGIYPADGGSVEFDGKMIHTMPSYKISHIGINRTYQVPKCFHSLTVQKNIEVALAHAKHKPDVNPVEFLELQSILGRNAGTLNTAQQKTLDLARALATGPKLLLVDELAAGLNPEETVSMTKKLLDLSKQGVSIIVVEHLLSFVNALTKRVIVMNAGRQIFEGDLESASKDPLVNQVYLGGDAV